MKSIDELKINLKEKFSIDFKDTDLIKEAFTQGNFLNENPNEKGNDYQRLEFLGDSVMQLQVATYVFKRYPEWNEGQLTELRIAMVQEKTFSYLSKEMNFDKYIRLGKGEEISGARQRSSLLEDIWEAFIGALYLDQGFQVVTEFLDKTLFKLEKEKFFFQYIDFKSKLQEKLQKAGSVDIEYKSKNIDNSEKEIFSSEVFVDGNFLAKGKGNSIKNAEKDAARQALKNI